MANRPSAITPNELAGYAKVMREAGQSDWSVSVEKPDGTKIVIAVGQTGSNGGSDMDKLLGLS
ncbi:hypothetical protein MU516_12965 [Paracoccus sp. YLB-12]|uniref:Uncharacterized protein n=1 Tax=Paracoccus maritimus TaxID=2933292 RepID=A0ABT2KB66_9RHOB|nr:hypothetical protein [Paracoccus sp. YLB-12]MCT4333775.1 hypothetical protein [Paracoccus sp. YLB-12]